MRKIETTKTGSAYLGRSRAGPHFFQAVFVVENVKMYKSYTQQVEILADRGMDMGDQESAVATLRRVNYYRLSGTGTRSGGRLPMAVTMTFTPARASAMSLLCTSSLRAFAQPRLQCWLR